MNPILGNNSFLGINPVYSRVTLSSQEFDLKPNLIFFKRENWLLLSTQMVWKLKQDHDCLRAMAVSTIERPCPSTHACPFSAWTPLLPQEKVQGVAEVRVIITCTITLNQFCFVILPAINGKIYNSLLGLTMNEGDRTNWYLIGMGNEVDVHTVHFHAQTFIFKVGKINESKIFAVWWEMSVKKSWLCSLGVEAWAGAEVGGNFACERNTKYILEKLLLWACYETGINATIGGHS